MPSRGGEDDSLSVKGRLLVEETTLDRASPREKGAMSRRLAAVKTLERTCWQFFFVLPRPARVAERVGTEMAQLDGKVLISAETALRVELASTKMRNDEASRGGDGGDLGEDGG